MAPAGSAMPIEGANLISSICSWPRTREHTHIILSLFRSQQERSCPARARIWPIFGGQRGTAVSYFYITFDLRLTWDELRLVSFATLLYLSFSVESAQELGLISKSNLTQYFLSQCSSFKDLAHIYIYTYIHVYSSIPPALPGGNFRRTIQWTALCADLCRGRCNLIGSRECTLRSRVKYARCARTGSRRARTPDPWWPRFPRWN